MWPCNLKQFHLATPSSHWGSYLANPINGQMIIVIHKLERFAITLGMTIISYTHIYPYTKHSSLISIFSSRIVIPPWTWVIWVILCFTLESMDMFIQFTSLKLTLVNANPGDMNMNHMKEAFTVSKKSWG